jgi:hypothetical protein
MIDGHQKQPSIRMDLSRTPIGGNQLRSAASVLGELHGLGRLMYAKVHQTAVETRRDHSEETSSIESGVIVPTSKRLTCKTGVTIRIAAVGVAVMMIAACGSSSPTLDFAEDTPLDLQELSREVWGEFLAVFPNQAGCIGGLTVEGDWTLEGSKAYYLQDEAKVVLEVPATAAHLRHSLLHEFAHHVEHACPDHVQMRDAFLEAQDLPTGTPWFEGPSWEETPSEQYAEAAVRLVLSRPVINYRLSLSSEAIEVVRVWGGGG